MVNAVVDQILALADAEIASEPAAPTTIGGRRILRRLDGGGMGTVYLAEQDHPRREIAIKVLKPQRRRLAAHEIEAAGRLRHSHIAAVYDAHLADPPAQSHLVMEFIPGARTITRYAADHRLDQAARLLLFRDAAGAIAHAHENGVLHCDIKPQNVLVDEHGVVKVIDFGLARGLHDAAHDHPARAGTLDFMSPEQLAGASGLTTRSDVFSLTLLLYELLTDRPAFEAPRETADDWRRGAYVPLRTVSRTIDADLEAIVAKGLAEDPAQRYADVNALLADLDRRAARHPVDARPRTTRYELCCCLRRHWQGVAVAAVLLLAVGVGVAGVWNERQSAIEARNRAITRFHDARELAFGLTNFAHELRNTLGAADMRSQMLHESLERLVVLLDDEARGPETDAALVRTLSLCAAMDIEYGRLDAARERLDRALAVYAELEAPPLDLQCDYSDVLVRRGDVEHHSGRPDAAVPWFEAAMEVDRRAHEANPGHRRAQDNLAWDYGRLGLYHMHRGAFEPANAFFEQQRDVTASLLGTHPGLTSSLHAHFSSHWNLARLNQRMDNADAAQFHRAEAFSVLDALLEAEPGSPLFRGYLVTNLRDEGLAAEAAGDLDAAQVCFEEVFEECRLLYQMDRGVILNTRRYLGATSQLARFWEAQGDIDRAISYACIQVEVAQHFASAFPEQDDARSSLDGALKKQTRLEGLLHAAR